MIDLIIPAYNAEETIGRALASIASQTAQRKFIVTVVDDCSTDNTAAIVQKFKGILPINYIKLKKNLGRPGLVRNEGIKRTHCPYIVFLDADDMLTPMAAETMSRAVLQHRPDIIIGQFLGENVELKEKDKYKVYGTNAITWLHGNVYNRKFLEINHISFDHRMNEDGSFNMKCVNLTDNIYKIEQPMAIWCNNRQSLTRSNDSFMLDISHDYIETYSEAIKFILSARPENATNKDFKNICGYKLAEFCEFMEANYYYNKPTEKLLSLVKDFVTLLKENELLDKQVISATNERFNNFTIFTQIYRQYTLKYYFKLMNIEFEG